MSKTRGENTIREGFLRLPSRIQCVTFDCYGTLIDWESGIAQALRAIPALANEPDRIETIVRRREEIEKTMLVSAPELPDEESPAERYESLDYRPYRAILADSIEAACRESGTDVSSEEAERAAATMPNWEPFPDTKAALEAIKSKFKVGILSNVENEVIEASIRKIGVSFDLLVTAEMVESYKPSPDHWYAAMHELTLDEDEILHLAASPFHDLETATLLGVPCGYVNRSGAALLPEAKPLFTVPDLASAARRLVDLQAAPASGEGQSRGRGVRPHRPRRGPQRGSNGSRSRR